ncbi:MAG: hypothetical protein QOH21_664 [Acidobacteriota bacterium]|nr:hypothetical protein [Acidobacteriota bacterium]
MTATNDTCRRRLISAFCCLALGLFFLTNPITRFSVEGAKSTGQIAMIGFVAPLHVALMAGALLGMTQLLRHRADRAGLIGATLVLLGWVVSTRIMVIGQLDALLTNGVPGVPANSLQKIFQHAPLVFASIFPLGLLFPIGLIVLGLTMAVARPIHRSAGVLLAIGGVLFPIGRIGGYEWAVVSSDLALAATFALTGWRIFTRPELWEGEEAVLLEARGEPAHA